MKLHENPILRMLAVVVIAAASIRLAFVLLLPLWPYLAAVAAVFAGWRIYRWHRDRW